MRQPTTPEDLATVRDQLREEISEARGTLKDLRQEIKAGREALHDIRAAAAQLAETHVRPLLEAEVKRQVERLGEVNEQAMRRSVEKVNAEFDKLRDLLLGHERPADAPEQRSIPELLQDPAILARAQTAARRHAREASRD